MPEDRIAAEVAPTQPAFTESTATAMETAAATIAAAAAPRANRNRKVKAPEVVNAVTDGTANTNPMWEEVSVESKAKLAHKIGIELTMIPELIQSGSGRFDNNVASRTAQVVEYAMRARDIKFQNDPHSDGCAVEVPSKPMQVWGEIRKWYEQTYEVMVAAGCIPHHTKITSGGGHIHVGGLDASTIQNLFRDIQNRPYLNWVFNEADDSMTANNFASSLDSIPPKLKEAAKTVTYDPSIFCDDELSTDAQLALTFFGGVTASKEWFPGSKGYALRYSDGYGTLEFRIFEAPSNWGEQEAHIRFVEAYISWVEKEFKNTRPVVTVQTKTDVSKFTREQCEKEFRAFLITLGLPAAPYERLIAENLKQRFQRGKKV